MNLDKEIITDEKKLRITNMTTNLESLTSVKPCTSWWSRLLGLIGKSALKPHEAFWLSPCNSIHTFGMKFNIDAYFLDKTNKVVAVLKNMRPGRISAIYFNAHSVLELASSGKQIFNTGDYLKLEKASC